MLRSWVAGALVLLAAMPVARAQLVPLEDPVFEPFRSTGPSETALVGDDPLLLLPTRRASLSVGLLASGGRTFANAYEGLVRRCSPDWCLSDASIVNVRTGERRGQRRSFGQAEWTGSDFLLVARRPLDDPPAVRVTFVEPATGDASAPIDLASDFADVACRPRTGECVLLRYDADAPGVTLSAFTGRTAGDETALVLAERGSRYVGMTDGAIYVAFGDATGGRTTIARVDATGRLVEARTVDEAPRSFNCAADFCALQTQEALWRIPERGDVSAADRIAGRFRGDVACGRTLCRSTTGLLVAPGASPPEEPDPDIDLLTPTWGPAIGPDGRGRLLVSYLWEPPAAGREEIGFRVLNADGTPSGVGTSLPVESFTQPPLYIGPRLAGEGWLVVSVEGASYVVREEAGELGVARRSLRAPSVVGTPPPRSERRVRVARSTELTYLASGTPESLALAIGGVDETAEVGPVRVLSGGETPVLLDLAALDGGVWIVVALDDGVEAILMGDDGAFGRRLALGDFDPRHHATLRASRNGDAILVASAASFQRLRLDGVLLDPVTVDLPPPPDGAAAALRELAGVSPEGDGWVLTMMTADRSAERGAPNRSVYVLRVSTEGLASPGGWRLLGSFALDEESLASDLRLPFGLDVTRRVFAEGGGRTVTFATRLTDLSPGRLGPRIFVGRAEDDGPGTPCTEASACASGSCVSGVCCDASCDGACATCLAVEGAPADGTCGARTAGFVCRPSAGAACDVDEVCDGTALRCPPDLPDCGDEDMGADAGSPPVDLGGDDDAGPRPDLGGAFVGSGGCASAPARGVGVLVLVALRSRRRRSGH